MQNCQYVLDFHSGWKLEKRSALPKNPYLLVDIRYETEFITQVGLNISHRRLAHPFLYLEDTQESQFAYEHIDDLLFILGQVAMFDPTNSSFQFSRRNDYRLSTVNSGLISALDRSIETNRTNRFEYFTQNPEEVRDVKIFLDEVEHDYRYYAAILNHITQRGYMKAPMRW